MKSPAVAAKKRHGDGGGAGFALGCGCRDAKSVSVPASPSPPSTIGTSSKSTTTTDTRTSASSFSLWEDAVAELRHKSGDNGRLQEESSVTTASLSGLLRELSELEKSVAAWGARKVHHDEEKPSPLPSPPAPGPQGNGRAKGDGRCKFSVASKDKEDQRLGVSGAGLERSVAVVKQSDDPLGDFRRSMLQLIVENGIVAGEDLREMLRRFLALNSPRHHDAILRAFAEIWDDVFVAASLDVDSAAPCRASVSRREPGRSAVPRTPPRHRRSPPSWRV